MKIYLVRYYENGTAYADYIQAKDEDHARERCLTHGMRLEVDEARYDP